MTFLAERIIHSCFVIHASLIINSLLPVECIMDHRRERGAEAIAHVLVLRAHDAAHRRFILLLQLQLIWCGATQTTKHRSLLITWTLSFGLVQFQLVVVVLLL